MVLYSRFFFLCFGFYSPYPRLIRQSLLVMRSTQISKAILSNMMLIFRGCQSVFHRRRMSRPQI